MTYSQFQHLAPLGEVLPQAQYFHKRRVIKSPYELEKLKKSAEILQRTFEYAHTVLKEGIEEKEVVRHLEEFIKNNGASGWSFDPIVAFGENSAYPHHITSSRTLKKNEIVLIDMGVVFEHYCSDMTRTFFWGEGSEELQKIHGLVATIQEEAVTACAPGVSTTSLYTKTMDFFKEHGVGDKFVHSLGHGVGLEIHEAPRLSFSQDRALEPGMVITIEPGLYVDGLGGVRIEDMVVITEDGYEVITRS